MSVMSSSACLLDQLAFLGGEAVLCGVAFVPLHSGTVRGYMTMKETESCSWLPWFSLLHRNYPMLLSMLEWPGRTHRFPTVSIHRPA